jgi:hypothetical protein
VRRFRCRFRGDTGAWTELPAINALEAAQKYLARSHRRGAVVVSPLDAEPMQTVDMHWSPQQRKRIS